MKEKVEEAIRGGIDTIFSKADSAQIYQGALIGLLGYSAGTEAALAVLEDTSISPPETTTAMRIILEEIARI